MKKIWENPELEMLDMSSTFGGSQRIEFADADYNHDLDYTPMGLDS